MYLKIRAPRIHERASFTTSTAFLKTQASMPKHKQASEETPEQTIRTHIHGETSSKF